MSAFPSCISSIRKRAGRHPTLFFFKNANPCERAATQTESRGKEHGEIGRPREVPRAGFAPRAAEEPHERGRRGHSLHYFKERDGEHCRR
jgi:hypothetical protein